ncbi:MAG: branched-chain amino acid ABC transporter permease [Chloroflexi bacterium]|nr:MAG: branched-chain amino acid ABC transporter permease [Chloroflexota bacterium]HDN79747.1 branched-chain amino acid ABC transporter permease [Chloroflexota bacterium]
MKSVFSKVRNTALESTLGRRLWGSVAAIPLMSWLIGALGAFILENLVGYSLALLVGLPGIPAIFGLSHLGALIGALLKGVSGYAEVISSLMLFLGTLVYDLVIYIIPTYILARLSVPLVEKFLSLIPARFYTLLHLAVFYGALHLWSYQDDYRLLVVRFIGIAIMLTVSLNLVNGYMGEFSCAHGGFMAVGAYVSSVIMVWGFVQDDVFGPPVLPPALAPIAFPIVLIIGGLASSLTALAVAIPSFRTRGDYLAIITLAFTFIVKSAIENMEVIGGPRGFMNQPKLAGLPWVFIWTVLCLVVIYNYVNSTYGKATCAVRDNETAAEVMTVDTRRIKVIAFLTSAFWAGVAGGLFAHVVGYINPATFGIMKSAEVLAMLYLGGLNSITGSIVGAVLFQLLSEILRPLKLVKWVVIPILLITVMIFRPMGLMGFREIRPQFLRPKKEVKYAPASD